MQGKYEPVFVDNVGNLFCNQTKPQNLRKKREEEESEWGEVWGNNRILQVNIKYDVYKLKFTTYNHLFTTFEIM